MAGATSVGSSQQKHQEQQALRGSEDLRTAAATQGHTGPELPAVFLTSCLQRGALEPSSNAATSPVSEPLPPKGVSSYLLLISRTFWGGWEGRAISCHIQHPLFNSMVFPTLEVKGAILYLLPSVQIYSPKQQTKLVPGKNTLC